MEEKVSVIIPNYNGRDLLEKNLPKVIAACSNCEIIVVDDASTDDSVNFLKKNFRSIIVIKNSKNLGFAKSANIAAKKASGNLILFLNSDVAPQINFLKSALSHFDSRQHPRGEAKESPSKHPGGELFAVGLADQSHENGKIVVKGRGGVKFKKGFVNHFALKPTQGETLWVSGGSGLFAREKFLQLGGFDSIFAPFYWEDIDLSYRARKQGLICLFEPEAKVDHYHEEGAIKMNYTPFFIKSISYRNQFLFVWKNITDYGMISLHFLWLPYHFAKAALTLDSAFYLGFILAVIKVPQLIMNYPPSTMHYALFDKEILRDFS